MARNPAPFARKHRHNIPMRKQKLKPAWHNKTIGDSFRRAAHWTKKLRIFFDIGDSSMPVQAGILDPDIYIYKEIYKDIYIYTLAVVCTASSIHFQRHMGHRLRPRSLTPVDAGHHRRCSFGRCLRWFVVLLGQHFLVLPGSGTAWFSEKRSVLKHRLQSHGDGSEKMAAHAWARQEGEVLGTCGTA